ncbi:MAG: class I SAM-dependent methyltransferase [Planctomycetes bacterium]|nr:class I SAM-dependent methyltransferase [Planctomycetota bacterium]
MEPAVHSEVVVRATDSRGDSVLAAAARELGLRATDQPEAPALLLVHDAEGFGLRPLRPARAGTVRVEFGGARSRGRLSGSLRSQPLARAVGIGAAPPHVLDATGGLGRDAWLLATLGCRVTLVERHRILAFLLRAALARAAASPATAACAARIELLEGDAREALRGCMDAGRPDVVYLDPMFGGSRRTALARLDLQVVQQLLGEEPDDPKLLQAARAAARRRVVVKRLRTAPPLAPGRSHAVAGQAIRFDVYRPDGAAGG